MSPKKKTKARKGRQKVTVGKNHHEEEPCSELEARALAFLESHVEKCAHLYFSSPWDWVEEAMDSRTRSWLGSPPVVRAHDRAAPSIVLSGSNPSLSPAGILSVEGAGARLCGSQRAVGSWHFCGHLLPVPKRSL